MSENTETEETVPTVLDEVKILRRADRRHHQRLDRIGRRLAKRDKRIAGMDRKIKQLETALATRTLDIDSLSRNQHQKIESKWKSKIEGWTENALAVADNPEEREYMERCRARAHEIWGCLDDINSAL